MFSIRLFCFLPITPAAFQAACLWFVLETAGRQPESLYRRRRDKPPFRRYNRPLFADTAFVGAADD